MKEIWDDIDATVDQLIANASAMKRAMHTDLLDLEVEALQRTQESLLARLVNRHTLLAGEKKKHASEELRAEAIRKKIADYGKTHARLIAQASKQYSRKKSQLQNSTAAKNR